MQPSTRNARWHDKADGIPDIEGTSHKTFTVLLECFWEAGRVETVYAYLVASLRDLETATIPRDQWKDYELGGMCEEMDVPERLKNRYFVKFAKISGGLAYIY